MLGFFKHFSTLKSKTTTSPKKKKTPHRKEKIFLNGFVKFKKKLTQKFQPQKILG